jgi:hypothetical protein
LALREICFQRTVSIDMSDPTPRQKQVREHIAAGKPFGRGKRTDLDAAITDWLVGHAPVSHIAKALGCHPRLVRRVRAQMATDAQRAAEREMA